MMRPWARPRVLKDVSLDVHGFPRILGSRQKTL